MIMEKTIKMTGTRMLLDLYEENPYEMKETESGFKLSKGEFDNPDTGDRDVKNPGILCAKVVEVGPECKVVKPENDIYVVTSGLRPVTINDKTYAVTFEENVILVFD